MSAPGHPKTKELRLVLGCSLPQAIGHLELLWHFCAQHSPAGDIGKWSDAAVADAAGWPDDPGKFIDGLVSTGWLERHSQYRLIIHDWRDHAPAWVSAKLHKLKIQWVASENDSRTLLDGSPSPTTLLSSPSLAKPSQEGKNSSAYALPGWLDEQAWSAWEQYRRESRKKLTPSTVAKQFKFLEQHRAEHVAIINQSIEKGWQGLFEIRGDKHGTAKTGKRSAVDRVRDATAEREAERQRRAGSDDRRTLASDDKHLRTQVVKPVR